MTAEPVSFAIAGCGVIAPTHAAAISRLGHRLVAVTDIDAGRAKEFADRFGSPRIHADIEALARDPEVEALILCTPSGMHADHAIVALSHGKHVMVEKPMDVTTAACDRLIEAAAASGRLCTVVSQHRFDTSAQKAKEWIDSGAIGRIVLATADVKWWREQSYYDSAPWRGTRGLDGGVLLNQAIHSLDLLLWLCGPVTAARAIERVAGHERIGAPDTVVLQLEFAGGAIGSLAATTVAFDGFPTRIEVHGTEGSILIEGDVIRRMAARDGRVLVGETTRGSAASIAAGGTASVAVASAEERDDVIGPVWGDAHAAQIADFVRAIRGGGIPLVRLAEARDAVRVASTAVFTR